MSGGLMLERPMDGDSRLVGVPVVQNRYPASSLGRMG